MPDFKAIANFRKGNGSAIHMPAAPWLEAGQPELQGEGSNSPGSALNLRA